MEKLTVSGVEIQFNDLSSEMQEKLYQQDKENFKKKLIQSQYKDVRKILISDEQTESTILDEIFEVEIRENGSVSNLRLIWNHINFKKDDEKREKLATSRDCPIRMIVAQDEECSSEFLNRMIRAEKQKDNDEDVIKAILGNEKFKIDRETFELFTNSKDEDDRGTIACYAEDSVLLNELLRKEVKGEYCYWVIDIILGNAYFEMEEETLEVLAASEDYDDREIAAKHEKSTSKFLNEILRKELTGPPSIAVIEAVMYNPNFQIEEETLNIIEITRDEDALMILIKDERTSKEWLEKIYLTQTDGEVLEELELRLLQDISETSIKLDVIKKRRIYQVLKELRRSKKNLLHYLKMILEIID